MAAYRNDSLPGYWSSCTNYTAEIPERRLTQWELQLIYTVVFTHAKEFLGMVNDFFTSFVFTKRALAHIPNDRNYK